MEILVQRLWKKDKYTIGRMFINGEKFCNTLEDKDRGLRQDMSADYIKKIKVYGETAIPTGRYKVGVAYWSKHKINVPILYNVPGYTGILIHNGTTQKDTLGCILVGENTAVGKVLNGKKYMTELTKMVTDCAKRKEEAWISIE